MRKYRLISASLIVLAFSAISLFSAAIKDYETITFPSGDGVEITADLYMSHLLDVPFIILFHQAGWSRGEYREIAPKLNEIGFNVMAVDLRSGDEVNRVVNQTSRRAAAANKPTTYLDAYGDMQAALKYADKEYAKGRLIVWGSSYSASLVLKLAGEYPNEIDGVVAFSPGEYFSKLSKSNKFVAKAAGLINCPVFITSAKDEKPNWIKIFDAIPSKSKHSFLPKTKGNHGSRSLWEKFSGHAEYWAAVKAFLDKYFVGK